MSVYSMLCYHNNQKISYHGIATVKNFESSIVMIHIMVLEKNIMNLMLTLWVFKLPTPETSGFNYKM